MADDFPFEDTDDAPEASGPTAEITPAEMVAVDPVLADEAQRLRAAYPPRHPDPVPSPGDGAARLGDILGRVQVVAAAPERAEVLQARLRELRARRREGLRATCNALGIPEDEDMREVVLDDDAVTTQALSATQAAMTWRGATRRGLVLVLGGERGLGKSAAIGWTLARHEGSALWVDAADVGATPRNGYSDNAHAWDRWLGVQLLALDDLGTEKGDPEDIVGLLAQRYNRGRASLVSTNLSRAQIAERYLSSDIGRRLADRLINAQGRAVRGDNGKLRLGDSGTPWYVALSGRSLRSVDAREALRSRVTRG